MIEKPKLVMGAYVKGQALTYECSLCCQKFPLPEHRSQKEAMAEVWVAFNDHVRDEHSEERPVT